MSVPELFYSSAMIGTLVFERPDWAASLKDALSQVPRPVRVISPCVGLNAPERAARELQMPWESTGDFEINPAVLPALEAFTEKPQVLHVGRRGGNVCNVALEDLDMSTDGIVSGPPCPPFSAMGKRLCELDNRSSVFVAVCTWIIHLATFGVLKFFVLENVEGIVRKRKQNSESFAEWFIRQILGDLPKGVEIKAQHANSIDFCLPQSGPRVLFVGTCGAMRRTSFQRRVLDMPLKTHERIDIIHFLDHEPNEQDFQRLSLRQQVNVLEQMDEMAKDEEKRRSQHLTTTVAICDIARDPSSKVDSARRFGSTNTLRTNNSHLWILPSAEWQAVFGRKGRLLKWQEKCRVAGIVPNSLQGMKPSDIDIAIGNTIPVSMIGSILCPIFRAWIQSARVVDLD